MKYKAVLFDLDGTLLDSLWDIAGAANTVLGRYGFPIHPVEAYKTFVGEGMPELVRRILPEDQRGEETVARCLAAMSKEYGRRWMEGTHPYAGVPELLDALVARGCALSVLSNKPDEFTKEMVARLLPGWPLAPVRGLRPGVPRKPDPAGALEIARLLGLAPGEFLYVGDSGVDMQTACSAGMYAVGVLWGFRTRDELEKCGARAVIDQPGELLAFLV